MKEQKNTNLALLAHLLGVFTSFVGPLIIWLAYKDQDKFVESSAREALNFQITIFFGYIAASVLSFIVIGFLLVPFLYFGNLILGIVATIKASGGVDYRYPLTLRLVK